jgi:hypothetical protein
MNYGTTAGRYITRDGTPFVSLNACKNHVTGAANFPYVDADAFAQAIPGAFEALRQYVTEFPAFTSKPIGAPESDERMKQRAHIALEHRARAALAKAGL